MASTGPGPVLILAPKGRDAALAAEVLNKAGVETGTCRDLDQLLAAISPDVGAIILAEEALGRDEPVELLERLARQEPWSDLPVLLLTHTCTRRTRESPFKSTGIVSFAILERPFRISTLISAVRAALRSRSRQFEVRDLLVQRDRAQQALAESEERRRAAIEAANVGTWDYAPDSGVLVWDDACRALFGLPPGTAMSYELFLERVHPEDRARTDAAVKAALSPGGTGRYQIEYRTVGLQDHVEHWVAATGRAGIHPQTHARRFSGTAIDITARKIAEIRLATAKEELEAANAAKDHFLATLSHELRTPLTPILMCLSELDIRKTDQAELREIVAMIRRNVQLEARLIDDLLDVTRVARGKLELSCETVDLHAILRAAIDVCSDSEVSRKRLVVLLDAQATRYHVWADSARLQQVFWNLLNNANKFTPEGGQVTVSTANPVPGRIAVHVRDNGMGLDPTKIPKLFSAFEQGDRAITRRYGGLGLGLAICRALVDLHGGTIDARSEGLGMGAEFIVDLKTVPAPPASNGDTLPVAPTEPIRGRILLVEDHDATVEVMARLLRRVGHDVHTALTVSQARDILGLHTFDLVISDLGLPDGHGVEVMQEAAKRNLPGIALSGYGMEQDVKACREAGFHEHLTKPIDWPMFHDAVQRLLAQRHPTS